MHAGAEPCPVLEEVGLLTVTRQGRYKYHHLNTTPLNQIVDRWLKPSPPTPEEEHP